MKKYIVPLEVLMVLCMFSCTSIYFDKPQPIDSENLENVPISFQGTWVQSQDTTVITGSTFRGIRQHYQTLPKHEIDTSTTIKINDGVIYDINDSTNRYAYNIKNDSIEVIIPELEEYVLSDSVLLKSVSKEHLLLNLKKDDSWWGVYLVSLVDEGSILVRSIEIAKLEKLSVVKPNKVSEVGSETDVLEINNKEFLQATFDKNDILELVEAGVFSDTIMFLNSKNKVVD